MSVKNIDYSNGYDDGVKIGKTEVLNDLMSVVLKWKASSDVVSCSTLMELLQQRKNNIEDQSIQKKEYRCFECGNKTDNSKCKFRHSTRKYEGDGYSFELDVESPYCEKCGAPLYDKEIEEEIRKNAHEIIMKQRKEVKQ